MFFAFKFENASLLSALRSFFQLLRQTLRLVLLDCSLEIVDGNERTLLVLRALDHIKHVEKAGLSNLLLFLH